MVLTGIGGVGKTQLAMEMCYRFKELNPEMWVFWVHASSLGRFEEGYREIAYVAKLPGTGDLQTVFQ